MKMISLAVNGGIGFGSKLTPNQLYVLSKFLPQDEEIELTTLQQLIIKIPEEESEQVKKELKLAGLSFYPVGPYVKSLRTCNFCKGEEAEGMDVAVELNKRISGKKVPFTLRPAYTGCPIGCGEPLVNDIGVIKRKKKYELYLGGKAKGVDARTGLLLKDELAPDELFDLVDKVINLYSSKGKKRERFTSFIDRYGFENIKHETIDITDKFLFAD